MVKIKKFLLTSIIALSICFGITSCTKGEDIEPTEFSLGNKYFDLVKIYGGGYDGNYYQSWL